MGVAIEKFHAFCFVFLTSCLFYYAKIHIRVPKGYKLPPGPPRKFLIGNLLDIPLLRKWETYHKWAKIHGELTYLNVCGTSILFVNSHTLVSELFDKRAEIYSDRFHSTMLSDLADWKSTLTLQPNKEWKHRRSLLRQYVGKSSMIQYQGLLEKSARRLLHRLYQTPNTFMDQPRQAIGPLIMEITYGIQTRPENDPYMHLAENALESVAEVSAPGAYLVDFLPILKYTPSWVPGIRFHEKAKELGAKLSAMATVPFAAVQVGIKNGNAPPSIVGTFLEEIISKGSIDVAEDEKIIQEIASVIYLGGIDTTDSVIIVFILAMVLYPDVQKKAQKEIDDLFEDRDSLPTFDDRKNLPYVDALCKEVLRWRPVAPIGFPHMLKEDDIIGEYFVPKGTIVVGNAGPLLHSESAYGIDTDQFVPERFLDPNTRYPDSAFGFGRRICPGRHLADSTLFIMITHILYAFDIAPCEGSSLPDANGFVPATGLVARPLPFKCNFIPRQLRQWDALLEQLELST